MDYFVLILNYFGLFVAYSSLKLFFELVFTLMFDNFENDFVFVLVASSCSIIFRFFCQLF